MNDVTHTLYGSLIGGTGVDVFTLVEGSVPEAPRTEATGALTPFAATLQGELNPKGASGRLETISSTAPTLAAPMVLGLQSPRSLRAKVRKSTSQSK